ncbi:MAG: DNA primase [Clostridia bacterium]|nr:DNA primase [Clostridia bacterium]
MALPQSFLDELIDRSDILDVVSRYVPLKKKGGDHWGCCPFHNEKTPSFHVNRERQIYKCFGCGEGGGVINFMMKIENLPYIDAVHKLADLCGMQVPEDNDADREAAQRRKRLLALNKDAARYYYNTLMSDKGAEARTYLLQKRAMTPQTVTRFGLGYADDSWDGLILAMKQKGYTERELVDARLANRGKNGGLYCFFRDRIMFPVIDIRGDVVAFGSRVLRGDGGGRKYMNSPDTPVYNKSRVLYAMNLAKQTKADKFILCEGNVDVIALHQAGFDSAVASCGTAFTAEQAKLLSKYTKEVVICYDADAAGQKATEKAIDILNAAGLEVRVLRLPPKRDANGRILYDEEGRPKKVDPDDFIKENGPRAFADLLERPQTDGQYRLGEIKAKYDLSQDDQRVAFLKEAARYLASLDSDVEREVFARNAARDANVGMETMLTEVRNARKNRQRRDNAQFQREALNPTRAKQPRDRELRYENLASALCEERLLAVTLRDKDLLEYAEARLDPEEFSAPFLRQMYAKALEKLNTGQALNPAAWMHELSEAETRLLTDILAGGVRSKDPRQELDDCIKKIKHEALKRSDDDNVLLEILRKKQEE